MILRIFVGIVLCVIGYYFVRNPGFAYELIGPVELAEKYFPGGSQSFFKFFGILIIMLGFLAITNLHGQFISWFVGFLG